jgi:hypothetical protein
MFHNYIHVTYDLANAPNKWLVLSSRKLRKMSEMPTAEDNASNFKNQIRKHRFPTERIVACSMLGIGSISIVTSLIYGSSLPATIGLVVTFWGAILLYVTPIKPVPLELLNATAASTMVNVEKVLKEAEVSGNGVYLPPKYFEDFESSLVFIPKETGNRLPSPREVKLGKLYSGTPDGLFLTPPGLALSRLFEKELGMSFAETNLDVLKKKLPQLLIEDLEIAEDLEIKSQSNIITIEATNCIFNKLCDEIRKLEKTHATVGCVFSSALACAIAKATGKPVAIQKEELVNEGKTTRIEFSTLE